MDYKLLNTIKDLKDFNDYAVDKDGNVYSFKYKRMRRLRPGWKHKKHGYQFVRLTDKYGNKRNFTVHRLVALAYLPTDDTTLEVNHKNRNCLDNRVENLEWMTHKDNVDYNQLVNGFSLDHFVSDKIKTVHAASIRKGLPVPNSYEFMNSLIEGALEQYINRYGLRKVMQSF
jgi:hypothetical protein